MDTYSWKDFGLDLLVGFAVLCVGLLPGALLQHFIQSTGIMLTICGAVFLLAAALRARPNLNPLLQGAAIGLGAGLPVLLAVTFLMRTMFWMFAAVVALLFLVCITGTFARPSYNERQFVGAGGFVVGTALLAVAVWTYGVPRLMTTLSFKSVDRPSPAFTLTRLDGTPVTLDSLKGKVVILDFWATWCAPCQAEMPALVTVYKQFQNNPDVVYIAVATGWDDDTDDKVRAFVARKHFPFLVALDPTHATQKFEINTIPTQILIDRSGHIRLINTGYHDNDAELKSGLASAIQRLLKQ